jgi:hypothetical protein|tara:strand:- start:221 stop:424 length:204 start_codon:yes stop_codon:yes gene_type:complete
MDFTLAYRMDTNHWGTYNTRLFGNHLRDLQMTNLPSAAPVWMAGQKGLPKWQANLGVAWQKDNASLR